MTVPALAACLACGTAPADVAQEGVRPLPAVAAAGGVAPVTFFDGRPLDLPSPDGRYRLLSTPAADGLIHLIAVRTSDGWRQVLGAYDPPTAVLWSPSSESFFVNDQRGSGQSSYLEVVRLEEGRFHRLTAARSNLNRLYNHLFECGLSDEFINTTGETWLDASTVVVEVQANLHSRGCALDPFAANQLLLLVNAETGEVRQQRALRRQTNARRRHST